MCVCAGVCFICGMIKYLEDLAITSYTLSIYKAICINYCHLLLALLSYRAAFLNTYQLIKPEFAN